MSDPRNKWKMARVVKLIPSEDGEIRECAVICKDVVMTRAVNHLYPLEINVEDGFEETRLIKQRMRERKALAEFQERQRLENAPAEQPPLREATEVLATTQEILQSPTRSQQAEVNEIREVGPAAEVGVSQAIHNPAPQINQDTGDILQEVVETHNAAPRVVQDNDDIQQVVADIHISAPQVVQDTVDIQQVVAGIHNSAPQEIQDTVDKQQVIDEIHEVMPHRRPRRTAAINSMNKVKEWAKVLL